MKEAGTSSSSGAVLADDDDVLGVSCVVQFIVTEEITRLVGSDLKLTVQLYWEGQKVGRQPIRHKHKGEIRDLPGLPGWLEQVSHSRPPLLCFCCCRATMLWWAARWWTCRTI